MRLARLPLAVALAMAGCIENPEPDPRIGKARHESREVPVDFQGFRNRLTLEVARDTGRLHLVIRNPGPGRIDSLRFLLKMHHEVQESYTNAIMWQTRLLREYFLAGGPIDSSDSLDLGEIDTLNGVSLHDVNFSAHVFALSQDGTRRGQHAGFAFQGLYQRVDSLGDTANGHVRGTLQADGKFSLGMSRVKNASIEEDLTGMLDPDGWFQGQTEGIREEGWMRYILEISEWARGRLRADGSGRIGTFHLFPRTWIEGDTLPGPDRIPKDSLIILIEPYSSG